MNAALPVFAEPLEIEREDGSFVSEYRSVRLWEDIRTLPPGHERTLGEPVTIDELMREEHHWFSTRPWVLGRFYFDTIIALGLPCNSRVLDLGCGPGRLGVWLIHYLDKDCYFGIDAHLRSLAAFARYEAVLHGLAPKRPRLMLNSEFAFARFGTRFDLLLDCYATKHLLPEEIERAYSLAWQSMAPGGRVIQPHAPPLGEAAMRQIGFELREVHRVRYPMLAQPPAKFVDEDCWHVYQKI